MERRDRVKWIWSSKDNAELAERYNRWAADYDTDLDEAYGWVAPEKTAAFFSRLVPKTARVLDAGAGTGLVGQALAARGYTDLVAADLSIQMLYQARKKEVYRAFCQCIMGETLPFNTDTFDAVISVGVLTHGHAPPSSFDDLIRIVRPGGHIVFTLTTDVFQTGGFKEKQTLVEKQRNWTCAGVSERFRPLPKGEPDVYHCIWAYRVL